MVRINETTLRIEYDNGKFTISPKLSKDGLDRIIIRKYYGIKNPIRIPVKFWPLPFN
ncbi:hypothetical protein BGP_4692 [Beggiatoa sp. PS]|nr:hypothetical protein BGP_4692 [Beggiatoa sp. PS]